MKYAAVEIVEPVAANGRTKITSTALSPADVGSAAMTGADNKRNNDTTKNTFFITPSILALHPGFLFLQFRSDDVDRTGFMIIYGLAGAFAL